MAEALSPAERLRLRLDKLEWSQADLARLTGASPAVVCRWLSGKGTPSLEMAFAIQRSKIGIEAEAWLPLADESGEHARVPRPPPSRTG